MTGEKMFALAAKLLNTSDGIELKQRWIDENTLYVYENAMGGNSLLVGSDGRVLFADSSIPFNEHLEDYRQGQRNSVEEFNEAI